MMTKQTTTVKLDNIQKYEFYDYPGDVREEGPGRRLHQDPHGGGRGRSTTWSMRPARAARSRPAASSRSRRHLSKSEEGKTYAITSIEHTAIEPGAYETGEPADDDYSNTFTCIPDSVTFRPPRITAKPLIHGSQTAVVVGPPGEEIYPDKYGRVKVQFFWDREGKRDDKTSPAGSAACRAWPARTGEHVHIPRIGQEVVVSFLEGDPDRPLITGVVYNADQMPPYPLPDEKTKSYIKTNSSKGGDGFNEIRFEDKKDSEQIFIHAEKDMDVIVKGEKKELIGKDSHLHCKAARNEKIDGDQSLTVGGSQQEKVSQKHALEAGQEIHLKSDMKIVIEAGMQLSLKGPGGFIDIGPSGVAIQGTTVLINSGGAAGAGSGSSPTAPNDPDDSKTGQKSTPF